MGGLASGGRLRLEGEPERDGRSRGLAYGELHAGGLACPNKRGMLAIQIFPRCQRALRQGLAIGIGECQHELRPGLRPRRLIAKAGLYAQRTGDSGVRVHVVLQHAEGAHVLPWRERATQPRAGAFGQRAGASIRRQRVTAGDQQHGDQRDQQDANGQPQSFAGTWANRAWRGGKAGSVVGRWCFGHVRSLTAPTAANAHPVFLLRHLQLVKPRREAQQQFVFLALQDAGHRKHAARRDLRADRLG